MEALTFNSLKAQHRERRDGFPQALSLRTHRALSWLHRAELEVNDPDARFIFLWISFNAAYGSDLPENYRFGETRMFFEFLGRLIRADKQQLLYRILWSEFPKSIRVLLNNHWGKASPSRMLLGVFLRVGVTVDPCNTISTLSNS